MKKLLIILLSVLMLTACTANKTDDTPEQPEGGEQTTDVTPDDGGATGNLAGGWTINADLPAMNDADFDEARKALVGENFTPLFKIGTQPVAGENMAYLCYGTTVTANPVTGFKVVTVFKDLENKTSEITNVQDLEVANYLDGQGQTTPEGLMGGWQDADNLPNMLTEDQQAVFDKALEGMTGVGYTPVAVLATQVVAGTNYVFLAQGTTVTANPVTHLYIIKVYADLQGNAEVMNIYGLDLREFNLGK